MKYQKFPQSLLKSILVLVAIAMVFGAFSQSAKAQYQEGDWMPFGTETFQAGPAVSLINADATEIVVQASMPGIAVSEVELFGERFLSFNFEGYDSTQEVGAPGLPVINQLIEVPLGADVSLEVLEVESQTIKLEEHGLNSMVAPVQPGQPKCGGPVEGGEPLAQFYNAGFYPESNIAILDDFIMRGHRIVHVQIRPVRFNGSNGELETASAITFKLNLEGSDMALTYAEADRLNADAFNDMLSPTVMNFNQGRPVTIQDQPERVHIFCVDDWDSGLGPLVTLKQTQGFTVTKKKLSEIGGNNTNSIKNHIKTEYQGPNPPVYVILVGDYMVDNPSTGLTNYTGRTSLARNRTDLYYFTMDDETEFVPDIFWGRFPVRSLEHLENMISNLTWYHNTGGDEDFVKKAEFLGSNDSSYGYIAENTHNYVIDTHLIQRGYTGIFPNNPQPGGDKIYAITYNATGAHAITSMNDNRAFVIYSGHGWHDLWDAPRVNQNDVRNLTGTIIPYVASHACVTAYYSLQESFGDTWVIQPGKAALVHVGASESTYWPEDETMEKAIFDHLYADPTDETGPTISAMMNYGLIKVQESGASKWNYYREAYQYFGDPTVKIVKGPKAPGFRVNVDPNEMKVCNNDTAEAAINVSSINNFDDSVALSASGMTGFTAAFDPDTVTPPGSATLNLAGDGTASRGEQTVVIKGQSGALEKEAELTLDVFPPIAAGPSLRTPADGAKNQEQRPTFQWTEVPNVESYTLQIAKDEAFEDIVHKHEGITSNTQTIEFNLDTDKVFYWRVIAKNVCGEVMSTKVFSFRTKAGPGDCPEGTIAQREYFNDFEKGLDGWTVHLDPRNENEWALSTAQAYSPVNSVNAKTPGITSDQRLDTPFFTVPSSVHPVAVLFMQRRDFAAGNVCSDGGVLEYSEDDGATWKALPRQHLILNPYNGTIPTGVYNPLANRQAWCYQQDWERTVVDMKAFAGKSIAFRYRLGTGRVDATDGWYVDDFSLQTCVEKPSEDPEYKNYVPLIFNND
ncbi:MAG: hypothetical protein GX853_02845 [Chloroflexi bacterium]|nr:hypothetical protein [Chloroflexota bacterium]